MQFLIAQILMILADGQSWLVMHTSVLPMNMEQPEAPMNMEQPEFVDIVKQFLSSYTDSRKKTQILMTKPLQSFIPIDTIIW